MADEGLHEIQLNGKQLVFIFMASTVVAVVIFLCGVMVGRGVRAQQPANAVAASVDSLSDPTALAPEPVPTASTTGTLENVPVASQETLTYPSRLEGHEPAEETLKPLASIPNPKPLAAKPVAPRPAPALKDLAVGGEPAGNGFVVQVAAVNDRREADVIAKRLAAKGYPSFVTTPPNGIPKMFRVRIGKYPTRREAETIAARLEKEDQFKPWITR